MTDEEIIEMARQVAGMITIHANGEATYSFYEYQLKTFAKLVAQHERLMCSKFLQETINPLKPEYIEQIKEGIWND